MQGALGYSGFIDNGSGGGGGGSQTWQQTLDVPTGSVLTHNNTIDGGGYNLTFDNNLNFIVNISDTSFLKLGSFYELYSAFQDMLLQADNNSAIRLLATNEIVLTAGGGNATINSSGATVVNSSAAINLTSQAGQVFADEDLSEISFGNGATMTFQTATGTDIDLQSGSGINLQAQGFGNNIQLSQDGSFNTLSVTGTNMNDGDGSYINFGNNSAFLIKSTKGIQIKSQDGQSFTDADGSNISFGGGNTFDINGSGALALTAFGGNVTIDGIGVTTNSSEYINLNSLTGQRYYDNDGSYISFGNNNGTFIYGTANINIQTVNSSDININSVDVFNTYSGQGTNLNDTDGSYINFGNNAEMDINAPKGFRVTGNILVNLNTSDGSFIGFGGGNDVYIQSVYGIRLESNTYGNGITIGNTSGIAFTSNGYGLQMDGNVGFTGTVTPVTSITVVNGIVTAVS